MGKTVIALRILTCPKCGKRGQLTKYCPHPPRKSTTTKKWYYRINHYKGHSITLKDTGWKKSGFVGEYNYCCYIGKEEP
jgi:hypothetical protein